MKTIVHSNPKCNYQNTFFYSHGVGFGIHTFYFETQTTDILAEGKYEHLSGRDILKKMLEQCDYL